MGQVTIRKGGTTIISNDLASVDHAPDGVVFNFADHSYYHVIDHKMPIEMKEKLVVSEQNFSKGNLVVDLNNPNQPIYADFTGDK